MDRRVDSLKKKAGTRLALLLSLSVFVIFLLAPLGSFIYESFFSDVARDSPPIDASLLKVIGVTLGRTLWQALWSTFFTLLLGASAGIFLVFCEFPLKRFCLQIADTFASLCFSLPGVSVAMFVLLLAKTVFWVPSQGLWAIVFAHVFMNFLFVGIQLYHFGVQWLGRKGQQQIEAAATLGAGPLKIFVNIVLRNFLPRFLALSLPTFLYSSMAFATVLILGGTPQQSTPEVLLFYFSNQDPTPYRLRLAFVSVLLFYSLLHFVMRSLTRKFQLSFSPVKSVLFTRQYFRKKSPFFVVAALLLVLPAVSFFVVPALAVGRLFVKNGFSLEQEWVEATLVSTLLAIASGVTSWGFYLMTLRTRSSFNRFVSRFIVFSPMMLVLMWMSSVYFGQLGTAAPLVQFFALAFGVSFSQWPLMAQWVEDRKDAFSDELFEAAANLGVSPAQVPMRLLSPLMADVERRVFSVLALISFGEISLATFIAPNLRLLATTSRQFAHRYDYFGISWTLLVMGLMSLLIFGMGWSKMTPLDVGSKEPFRE